MKKLYALFLLMSMTFFAQAQEREQKQQNIEALKVAFISKELQLTPEEAQKFWPVYNQYSRELRSIIKEDEDIIERDEKVLNLRKKYRDQFSTILGTQRMNRIFNAEGKFRELLIKSMRRQQRKS